MDEYVHRQYLREEEFLEVNYETVDTLLERLGQEWRPNYQCNEAVRQRHALLLARGELAAKGSAREVHAQRVVGGVLTFSVTAALGRRLRLLPRWWVCPSTYFPKMRRRNPLPFLPPAESAG
jgi:hypothetical protein